MTSTRLNEGSAAEAAGARSGPGPSALGRLERSALVAAKLLVWSLVAMWAVSSLWYPFGWDQGIFAWVGDTILGGGMPYRDAFDLKGPAAHVIFALVQAVFGRNQWGIRVVDLVGIGVSAWHVAKVVRHHTVPGVGHWAAALLVLWFGGLTFWHTAQPDGFAAMLFCAGFLPLLGTERSPGWARAVGAGLAVGVAIAMKPSYAVFLLVPAVIFFGRLAGDSQRAAGLLAAATASASAVVGVFLAWFALEGAIDALVEVHLVYNASIYAGEGGLSVGSRLQGLVDYILAGEVFVIALPAAAVGGFALSTRDRVAALALITWAFLAVAGVVIQNKFFDYQWTPLFAPVVILAAIGLHSALSGGFGEAADGGAQLRSPSRLLGVALSCAILVHATVHPAFEVLNWASYITGLRDKASYYDTFGVPGDDFRMVERLRAHGRPGDRLFVMAWNAELLHATGLEPVSRFGYSLPFWMGEGSDFQARYRREVMAALGSRTPNFIVVAPPAVPLVGRVAALEEFPEFVRFLNDAYVQDATFGDLTLYRLR